MSIQPNYVTIYINSQKITAPEGSEVEAEGIKVKIPVQKDYKETDYHDFDFNNHGYFFDKKNYYWRHLRQDIPGSSLPEFDIVGNNTWVDRTKNPEELDDGSGISFSSFGRVQTYVDNDRR